MSQKFVQTQAIALYSGMSADATSCIVTPYPTDLDGNNLEMDDFGSSATFTVDPKIPNYEEICSFTDITDNGDNTATLSGLVRNLLSKSPYTTPGTGKQHGASAVIVFSDNPQLYARLAALENNNVFTGVNEGVVPTTAMSFVTRDWILALINGGAISVDSEAVSGILQQNSSAGNLLYLVKSPSGDAGRWNKVDALSVLQLLTSKLGIAQADASAGQTISIIISGRSAINTGFTPGAIIYASNSGGGFSETAATIPRVVGIANDQGELILDPNFLWMPYAYAVDSVGTDAYAVTLPESSSKYFTGMEVAFKVGTANTGTATLAVNGGTAKTIKKGSSSDLETGDLIAGQIAILRYDGTFFQLVSAYTFLASSTVAGRVEEATGAEANDGTAAGGTGAQLYLNPAVFPAKNLIGALGNAIVKTYFNVQLLFMLWTGSTSGAATTDFPNWVRSSEAGVGAVGAVVNFYGTGADYIWADIFGTGSGDNLPNFQNTNIIILDWFAKLAATGAGDVNMGFGGVDLNSYTSVYNSTTYDKVSFIQKGTGELYATNAKAGVGVTNTDISSGLTLTNYNNYRIELTLGTSAKFYVNGVLKATIATNLQTGNVTLSIGFGRSNTSLFRVTAPNMSLQLI